MSFPECHVGDVDGSETIICDCMSVQEPTGGDGHAGDDDGPSSPVDHTTSFPEFHVGDVNGSEQLVIVRVFKNRMVVMHLLMMVVSQLV